MKRLVTGALTLAAVAGVVRIAPHVRRKAAAVAAVPEELRSPAMFLPLHLTSPAIARFVRSLPSPPYEFPPRIRHDVRTVSGRDGRPDVRVHLYERADRPRPTGVLYWIHGGGFVIGEPAMSHGDCATFADELNVLVVSIDYRLAPENPFPEGIEDCYTGLRWVHDHAEEIGIDRDKIAVGGSNAGGGLAACLTQLAHDRGEVGLCFQLLVYPMLDDRTVLRDDHGGTGEFVWSPASNRFGWTSYLGRPPVAEEAPAYAVGARRTDLSGLPPAWIGVGDIDLFHAEDVAYADRLRVAGVPCDLHVVPGMYHAADGFPGAADSPTMITFNASKVAALRPAIG
ncbi:MAG TPA: alpha/beta hydrolase [Microlunatus sp.]